MQDRSSTDNGKATAVVCCYNEEDRVGKVLEVLTSHEQIKQVIVVNDGYEDNSAEVIKQYDTFLIQNDERVGKGEAVRQAMKYVSTDLVLMCDADLIGLRKDHITKLIAPVVSNERIMSIAALDKYWHMGSEKLKKHLMLIPINGTRVMQASHLREACQHPLFSGWGIETVINHVVHRKRVKIKRVNFNGVRDVIKTRKKHHGLKDHVEETLNVLEVNAKLLPKTALTATMRAAHYGIEKLERIIK